jgi:hypothetical protein
VDGRTGNIDRNNVIYRAVLFIAVAAILAGHAWYYYPFLSDDALISLRYAHRLIQGLGLTWTDGERVEGYTNFLWVLITAGFGYLGFDLITIARSIDFFGALGALYAVSTTPNSGFRLDPVRLITAGMILALCAPLAVWSIGGLEHGFMAGILAGALVFVMRSLDCPYAFNRSTWAAGFLFAVLALLRADGIVIFGSVCLGVVASQTISRRCFNRILALSIFPCLFLVGQMVFRVAYYGEFFPNTVYAKVRFNSVRLESGLKHIAHGWLAVGVLGALAVLAVVLSLRAREGINRLISIPSSGRFSLDPISRNPRNSAAIPLVSRNRLKPNPTRIWAPLDRFIPSRALRSKDWTAGRQRLLVPLSISAGWSIYLIVVGGDIFPGWRQLLIAIVPIAFIVGDGADYLAQRIKQRQWIFGLCWVGILSGYLALQSVDSENRRAKAERWEWGGYPVGTLLKRAFSKQRPLLAVDAAGALPYWSELPALDMLGLNDRFIARHPPPTFGTGQIGHELGNGEYVWNRSPDIIAFNGAVGARNPVFRSGKELIAKSAFKERYQLIRVQGDIGNRAFGNLYLKREGGPLGIQRSSQRIQIPGYLFSETTPAGAHIDNRNQLTTLITGSDIGQIRNLDLDPGAWEISIKPPLPEALVALHCQRRSANRVTSKTAFSASSLPIVIIEDKMPVDILVGLDVRNPTALHLEEVSLTRVSQERATQLCGSSFSEQRSDLEALSIRKLQGTFWAHPGNTVMTERGLLVSLPVRMRPIELEISTDSNDVYGIQYLSDGVVLAQSEVGPKPLPRGGLALYTIPVPPIVSQTGITELKVEPKKGDLFYAVGHLILSTAPHK